MNQRGFTIITMIAAAALARFIPHPPNFAPITAMALFGGAQFPRVRSSMLAVFSAMLISDAFLGFHPLMPAVYLSLALIIGIGVLLRKRNGVLPVAAAAVLSSVVFFVVTNAAEWAYGAMYPHNLSGLVACFTAAIPFFHNTVAGDLLYTGLLFGGFALTERKLGLNAQPV